MTENNNFVFVECPVCFEGFTDDEDHVPLILKCGHSFCKRCICTVAAAQDGMRPEDHVAYDVKCPIDRSNTFCLRGKNLLESLPKNFQLLEAVTRCQSMGERGRLRIIQSPRNRTPRHPSSPLFQSPTLHTLRAQGGHVAQVVANVEVGLAIVANAVAEIVANVGALQPTEVQGPAPVIQVVEQAPLLDVIADDVPDVVPDHNTVPVPLDRIHDAVIAAPATEDGQAAVAAADAENEILQPAAQPGPAVTVETQTEAEPDAGVPQAAMGPPAARELAVQGVERVERLVERLVVQGARGGVGERRARSAQRTARQGEPNTRAISVKRPQWRY